MKKVVKILLATAIIVYWLNISGVKDIMKAFDQFNNLISNIEKMR